MITLIKKISDVGVFKKYESRKTGLSKDFGKFNLVYGLNTYEEQSYLEMDD